MLEGSVAMRPTRRAAGTFGLGLGLAMACARVVLVPVDATQRHGHTVDE